MYFTYMPRPKGLPKTGGRKQGSRNKTTLLQMERRAIFDAVVSQKWEEVIDKLPPQYIADQFMGKAANKVELNAKVETPSGLTQEQIDAINKIAFGD